VAISLKHMVNSLRDLHYNQRLKHKNSSVMVHDGEVEEGQQACGDQPATYGQLT
jgi:hypothetical protein